MKIPPLLTLSGALIARAAQKTVFQDVDESFQGSDYSFATPDVCLKYYNCSVKHLPFPGDGLKWTNLVSYRDPLSTPSGGEIQNVGLVPIDTDLGHDYYYAKYVNTSQPATISKNYAGTLVASWTLHGLDFGCSAAQSVETSPGSGTNFTDVLYANCSLKVEGFNNGRLMGIETFHSVGHWDGFLHPIQYHMSRFSTTEGGLKGRKVARVRLTAAYEAGPGKFVGDLVLGIDEVKYTLYNKTKKP